MAAIISEKLVRALEKTDRLQLDCHVQDCFYLQIYYLLYISYILDGSEENTNSDLCCDGCCCPLLIKQLYHINLHKQFLEQAPGAVAQGPFGVLSVQASNCRSLWCSGLLRQGKGMPRQVN